LGQYDRDQIELIGQGLDDHIIQYRLHELFEKQIEWIGKDPPTPSPFLSVEGAEVRFSLPMPDDVAIRVCDIKGRRVRELVSGVRESGRYSITWDGRDDYGSLLASGSYFVALRSEAGTVWGPSPVRL
jgi:flagellar hook assembly protein FlgD